MNGEILAIREKVPEITTLPDGVYTGTWGGNCITLSYKGKTYELETSEGVRGVGYKVMVQVENGKGTFTEINN